MRVFGRNRPDQLRQQLMDHFKLPNGTADVSITVNGSDKGTVIINTLTVPEPSWSGVYFKDLAPTVRAIPNEGASFAGWSGAFTGDTTELILPLDGDDVAITATFE